MPMPILNPLSSSRKPSDPTDPSTFNPRDRTHLRHAISKINNLAESISTDPLSKFRAAKRNFDSAYAKISNFSSISSIGRAAAAISSQTNSLTHGSALTTTTADIYNKIAELHTASCALVTTREAMGSDYNVYDMSNAPQVIKLRNLIFNMVLTLCEAFPQRVFIDDAGINWISDDAMVYGASLGKFKVTLKPGVFNPLEMHPSRHLRITPYADNASAFQGMYTNIYHPHSSGVGAFCLGEANHYFNLHFKQGNIVEALCCIQAVLNNKTPFDGLTPFFLWFLTGGRYHSISDPCELDSKATPVEYHRPIRPMLGYTARANDLSVKFNEWLNTTKNAGKLPPRPDPEFVFEVPDMCPHPGWMRYNFKPHPFRTQFTLTRNNTPLAFRLGGHVYRHSVAPFPHAVCGLLPSLDSPIILGPEIPRCVLVPHTPTM